MLSDLQRQIHQHAIDARSNFQRVQLFLFELRQGSHLIDFGLLLGHLRLNRPLIGGQPLRFKIVSRGELVRLVLGRLVGQARDDAEIVERLVGVRLRVAPACSRHGR